MEFPAIIGTVLLFCAIMMWRRGYVIEAAPEHMLMAELKRRALMRKLKAAADTEVENAVNREVAGGTIPH